MQPPASSTVDKTAVLVIFALTYFGLAVGHVPRLKLDRTGIALLGAIAMMVFSGLLTTDFIGFINWPTVLLLFGFFVLSAQLRLSGLFDKVAHALGRRLNSPARFLLTLMLAVAGLSAVLNHDIVCFAFAPVLTAALVRKQLNPVPFLVALAIASNIGAAATLVGNPQNMMIGQIGMLSFGRYALWSIVPVLFALGCSYFIIWRLSRERLVLATTPSAGADAKQYPFSRPHTIKGLIILAAVIGLFFSSLPKEIVALTAAGIHLASPKFRTSDLLGLVDWPILVLFMSLFVVTGAFQTAGYGDQTVQWAAAKGLHLESSLTLAAVTALLSNLIGNSAAVMLLIKTANVTQPPAAYVLALANSFGGSLIIVGSVSNLIVVQQARELGIKISFRDFARIGIPVTLAALAGLVIWTIVMN